MFWAWKPIWLRMICLRKVWPLAPGEDDKDFEFSWNIGWYTHMQSLEEVREEALRYMNVIARPMVLQGDQHPIVWSHAYADFQVTFTFARPSAKSMQLSATLVFVLIVFNEFSEFQLICYFDFCIYSLRVVFLLIVYNILFKIIFSTFRHCVFFFSLMLP